MSIIVFILVLISGSFFGITYFNKKFEEILPITSFGIVCILFLCGICERMQWGPLVILLVAIFLYLSSIIKIWKEKQLKPFLFKMITPGFLVFMVSAVVFLYIDYGLLVVGWDEFTHWADIVKAMIMVDDFGTNVNADSLFQAYPPGMSLFQYFLQKIQIYFGQSFSEWKLYYAYQMFLITIVSPIFSQFSLKKPAKFIWAILVVILAPMVFFPYVYSSTYIDPVLGILSASALSMIWFRNTKERVSDLYIALICSMLVLMKDVGIVFAVFLILAEFIIEFKDDKKSSFRFLFTCGLTTLIPKLLWSYYLKAHAAARVFSDHLDIKGLVDTILNDSECYQRDVFQNFFKAVGGKIPFLYGQMELEIPYPLIIILIMGGLILINNSLKRYDSLKKSKGNVILTISGIQLLVYIIGLSITYATNFSAYEALNLASFDRYMNIVFLSLWFLLAVAILNIDYTQWKQRVIIAIVGIIIMSGLPWQEINWMGTRYLVERREEKRSSYAPLCEKIERIPDKDAHLYLISQEDDGYDYWLLKFCARPLSVNTVFSWSIGTKFYDSDMYTLEIDALEWKEELKKYDYVALYHLNEYFYQHFSELFEKPEEIRENEVYKVNEKTGLLEISDF